MTERVASALQKLLHYYVLSLVFAVFGAVCATVGGLYALAVLYAYLHGNGVL